MSFAGPNPSSQRAPNTRSSSKPPAASKKSGSKQPTLSQTLNRNASRNSNRPEEEDEIDAYESTHVHDAKMGELHLRSLGLIRPQEQANAAIIGRALHVIANNTGVVENMANRTAILACAYLLEKLSTEVFVNEVTQQITETLKQSFADIKSTLQDTMAAMKNELIEATTKANETVTQASNIIQETYRNIEQTTTTYKDALTSNKLTTGNTPFTATTNIDPRTRAREAIRLRQILLNVDKTKANDLIRGGSTTSIVGRANDTLKTLDNDSDKHSIRAAKRLENGGLLLEANCEEAARWIIKNAEEFTECFGAGTTLMKRTYTMIARFVTVDFNPTSVGAHMELATANNFDPTDIASMKWIKPEEKRSQGQKAAHLMIKLHDPDLANRLTVEGIYIHHERVNIERERKEPLRCYKCQGWDHLAANCERAEFCGRCGDAKHTMKDCKSTDLYCTPCGKRGHASGDRRACPIFKQKCDELNARIPENTMPYYPTKEAWTFALAPKTVPNYARRYVSPTATQPTQRQRRPLTGREPPLGREMSVNPTTGSNATQVSTRQLTIEPHYRGTPPPDN